MGKLCYFFVVMMSMRLFGNLAITDIAYDKVNDELVVNTEFPGKCLEHELNLVRSKARGAKNYFRLSMTNSTNDPCNAIVRKQGRFSLADITDRPAEILISAQVDGSKPHFMTIPPHAMAPIVKVRNHNNGSLVFSLRARGPFLPERFYLDMSCNSGNGSACAGIVRDRYAARYNAEPIETRDIVLVPMNIPRPQTLVFTYDDSRRTMRIFLP
jgi:hypothetical protein